MIAPYPRSVQPSLPTLVGLFVAFVTGGYGVGTFFGKLYLGIVVGIVLS